MKLLLALLLFCLYSFNTFAQSKDKCGNFIFGDYVSVSSGDSLYIFRCLSHWMEYDVKKGDTYTFDIQWRNDCNFRLHYGSSDDVKEKKYKEGDTLNYSYQTSTDSGVTYTVNTGKKTYQQTLTKKKGLDVLQYVFNHDKDFQDEIKNGKGGMFSLSDTGKSNIASLEKSMKDFLYNAGAEKKLSYIILQLRQNNFLPVYSIAGPGLKTIITDSVMMEYSSFLKKTYGQLKTYDVTSYSVKGLGNKINFASPLFNEVNFTDSTFTYELKSRFANVDSNVTISLTFEKDSDYKLLMINVVAAAYTPSDFINSICAPFWKNIESNQFDSIYNSTIDTFKKMVTPDRMKYILNYVKSKGNVQSYHLYKYDFGAKGKTSLLYISYVTGEGDKLTQLTLVYNSNHGNYKLAGINIK